QLRDTPVYGAKSAVQRSCESDIIERIDQLFEAALRACQHLAELVQLLFGGRCPAALFQPLQQVSQLCNLPATAVDIDCKEHRNCDQSKGYKAKTVGQVL